MLVRPVLLVAVLLSGVSMQAEKRSAAHGQPAAAVAESPAVAEQRMALAFATEAARRAAGSTAPTAPTAPSKSNQNTGKREDSINHRLENEPSSSWSIVIGLTLLSLLPAILLSMTPLVRLLVVFHFLRQALGTQTAPSNQVLMGLGLMMTWFLMQPVLVQVDQQAVAPFRAGQISGEEAIAKGSEPVKVFMLKYAREKDLALFASAGMAERPQTRAQLPMQVVVPAYILSELKAGFQIGAILFLPFLLIDLVVASVTTSIGMMQLPPVVISTPLKILLFVMVDGWNLLTGSLLKSFS
ncbi:flagellar type III secretion system pore protein FliP [Terriglobus sp. 2YAB30_2]|uniref:flagellar type III secretion system pore protein FliP n=1 Tax=unclassified Terriglobus TaxID=2628988 RepID=UPI003F94B472